MFKSLLHGFTTDRRDMSLAVACLRVVRSSPAFTDPGAFRALLDNPACRAHRNAIAPEDRFFFVAHRHYLVQGLSRRSRIALARHHYAQEVERFDDDYLQQVYERRGLVLWRHRQAGADYEIRLEPGHDTLTEGGASVVLYVAGGRVCVLSYSHVDPAHLVEDWGRDRAREPPGASRLLLTRKQLGQDHGYQRPFHRAFDRCTPAHMGMAAVAGIARALGHDAVMAVQPQVHPGFTPDRAARFEAAYGRFWASLAGRIRGRFVYELPVPLWLPDLDALSPKARRRARARRAHLAEIEQQAHEVMSDRLRAWPGPGH